MSKFDDGYGHGSRYWRPPFDGLGMRAKQRSRGPVMSYDAIQAEISKSRAHWAEFRKQHGMPAPTYTKMDRMVSRGQRDHTAGIARK
jgi:hypothetical protein